MKIISGFDIEIRDEFLKDESWRTIKRISKTKNIPIKDILNSLSRCPETRTKAEELRNLWRLTKDKLIDEVVINKQEKREERRLKKKYFGWREEEVHIQPEVSRTVRAKLLTSGNEIKEKMRKINHLANILNSWKTKKLTKMLSSKETLEEIKELINKQESLRNLPQKDLEVFLRNSFVSGVSINHVLCFQGTKRADKPSTQTIVERILASSKTCFTEEEWAKITTEPSGKMTIGNAKIEKDDNGYIFNIGKEKFRIEKEEIEKPYFSDSLELSLKDYFEQKGCPSGNIKWKRGRWYITFTLKRQTIPQTKKGGKIFVGIKDTVDGMKVLIIDEDGKLVDKQYYNEFRRLRIRFKRESFDVQRKIGTMKVKIEKWIRAIFRKIERKFPNKEIFIFLYHPELYSTIYGASDVNEFMNLYPHNHVRKVLSSFCYRYGGRMFKVRSKDDLTLVSLLDAKSRFNL